jgi:hypothetical protein
MRQEPTLRIARKSSSCGQQPLAYEQTRSEFESHRSGFAASTHRELVRLALAARRHVPARVLSDYPDLLIEHFGLLCPGSSRFQTGN